MNSRYLQALKAVLTYAESAQYAGYSKYDALNSPVVKRLTFGIKPLQWAASQAVMRFPVNIRPLLGVKRSINPKGMGLFALTYLHQAEVTGDEGYIEKARYCLDWLINNHSTGYSGICWGYDHLWPGLHFTAPKYFPNLIVTGNCTLAFIYAYEQLGDQRYLDVARDSLEFIRYDLKVLHDTPEIKAYSYVPNSDWVVINPQGMAAILMAKISQHTQETDLADEARRLMTFVISKQTDYGGWFYADPPESTPVKHDNYHSGNVLDWVLLTGKALNTDEWLPAYRKGLAFYQENLFLDDGAPKARHDRNLPFNVHGAAQGAITFARAAMVLNEPEHLVMVDRILDWTLEHLCAPDGHFYYESYGWFVNRTSLMRWNQAWMACALGYGLLAHQRLGKDE